MQLVIFNGSIMLGFVLGYFLFGVFGCKEKEMSEYSRLNYLPKATLEGIIMLSLCSACNKEYECGMDGCGAHNFVNCPHCGVRNDRWILLKERKRDDG